MGDGSAPSAVIDDNLVVPPDPVSPARARRFVRDALAARGLPRDMVDLAVLLASELTTNAVLHARSDIVVTVRLRAECLRVEVADENPRLPSPTFVSVDALSGRGLHIIERVADSWGIDRHDEGKVVWFELAR